MTPLNQRSELLLRAQGRGDQRMLMDPMRDAKAQLLSAHIRAVLGIASKTDAQRAWDHWHESITAVLYEQQRKGGLSHAGDPTTLGLSTGEGLVMQRSGLGLAEAGGFADIETPTLPVALQRQYCAFLERIQVLKPVQQATNSRVLIATPAEGAFTADNPGSDQADGSGTITPHPVTPHQVITTVEITRQLLIAAGEGEPRAIALVYDTINEGLRRTINNTILNGSGTSNEPVGLLATTFLSTVALGTHGDNTDDVDITGMLETLAGNGIDPRRISAVTSAAELRRWRQKARTNSAEGNLVSSGRLLGEFAADADKVVPSDLTKGTATSICSPFLFGDFGGAALIDLGADMTIDQYTLATMAKVRVVHVQWMDVAIVDPSALLRVLDAR